MKILQIVQQSVIFQKNNVGIFLQFLQLEDIMTAI